MQKQIPGTEDKELASLTDLLLAEKIIELQQDKARVVTASKRYQEEMVRRIQDKGLEELKIGDELIVKVQPKLLTEYDPITLGNLNNCITDDKLWYIVQNAPSGKQLIAMSEIGGTSAKAVIASAKKKIDTGTKLLKFKRPKKKRSHR